MNRFFVALAALLFCGAANAQQQRLTASRVKMTASEVFLLIREQTGLGVAWRNDQLNGSRQIVLPATSLTVDEAMAAVDAGVGARHTYNGRIIVLSPAPEPVRKAVEPVRRTSMRHPNVWPDRPREEAVEQPEPLPATIPAPAAPVRRPTPVSHGTDTWRYAITPEELPWMAVKTNLLYGFGTLTPNLAVETGLGERTTLELSGSYNPWNRKGSLESNRKLVHMLLRTEVRHWFCERFNGGFAGVHGLFGRYNIGSNEIPMLFKKEYRYDGVAYGGGVSYGYNWMLGKRWNLELVAGVGVVQLDYDRFDCAACAKNPERVSKTYFGPTRAAVNIVFLIK